MVNIREANIDDAYYLTDKLRQADLDECLASHGVNGDQAILLSYNNSTVTYVAEIDGVVICMFGVVKYADGGYPWLLGTDLMSTIPVTFLKQSRKYIYGFLKEFKHLENYVDARNSLSIQWLKWLGFHMEDPKPYGMNQELFHRFTLGGG